ncbi:MAG: Tn3 family transposase, partial [Desulfobacteria bacterium]
IEIKVSYCVILQELVPHLKQVDIGSVLEFTNRHYRFMDAFEHVLGRYVKTQADERTIFACILAWGTNTGLGRMGQISGFEV